MTNHQFRINLDRKLFNVLEQAARTQGISINRLIVDTLIDKFGNGADRIILGWVKLDRLGELDRDEVCNECGQDLQSNDAYVGLVASGGFHGPVCGGCATSE